ncbi:MAG: sulfite exporter TauE/SafE family protein, partial [Actinomycetia bacterium]|nr:sulfite exporter TauE/SafE family protein [Actinomycetes bacterium]
SLIAMVILSIPGVIEQALLGNVDYLVGIAVVLGSIPGAIIGSVLVKRVPERTLRLAFSAVLLIMSVFLVLKEFYLA